MPLPVLSIAQMRQWENATWAAGQSEREVIRRVGAAAAARVLELTAPGQAILLIAGKGHNGDDVRAMAEHLKGRKVETLNINAPATDLDALRSRLKASQALVVDGLFGIGLDRPLEGHWAGLVDLLNAARQRVVSIDVPSGLDADSGLPLGSAVRASVTLTVGAPKAGLLRPSAWPFVGRLEVLEDVGLVAFANQSREQWTVAGDFRGFPPARPIASHKGKHGHLAIVAGSAGFHGAAVLAARGAQRAAPGLIALHVPEEVYGPIASQTQAVMVSRLRVGALRENRWTAILIGPGLADPNLPGEIRELARDLWLNAPVPLVVDASALDWLPNHGSQLPAPRVITPHPGEAGRMLGRTSQEVQEDRFDAVRELSRRFGGAWVVLKGHQTVVGNHSGPLRINSTGNPSLGQGGSGDVLAGFLAGLVAQPDLQRDMAETAAYSVFEHGAAADRLQARRPGWIVEELAGELGFGGCG